MFSNPYLPAQAQAFMQQANQNLQTNILPNLRSNAIAADGFGGSRRGIAEGLAIGQTQQGIANGLANLFGNAYEQDANRGLQQQSINNAFFTSQRGQDLQQAQLGASLFGQGQQGLAGQGQGTYQAGLNQFQAGYQPFASYANLLQPFTGLNSSQVNTQPGVSPLSGLLGGFLGGAQLGKIWGG